MEESFWDMKVSLVCFNTLMDGHKIPDDDFEFK
jgi:hypothetical protein